MQLFETIDGDHFTILGMPLLPLARRASRARACSPHDQDRAHRLDRHGQVDRRRACSSGPGFRCSTRTPWCAGCRARVARWSTRSASAFPRHGRGGSARPRHACAARARRSAASSPRSRRSFTRRCAQRVRAFVDNASRRAGAGVRYPAAVRDRRRGRVRQGRRRLRAARGAARARARRAPA